MSDRESSASGQADESSGNSTTFCPFCNVHLAFPTGSAIIQCPQCSNTLDPNAQHQIRCAGCKCLLAYPPNALYIQCPKCMNTMDPRSPATAPPSAARDSHTREYRPSSHKFTESSSAAHPSIPSTEPKKRRDPNMPKAVCNAYMVFCRSRRNDIKYEYPDLPFGKIGAKLGEIWRNMSNEEKRPYDDRAAVDRERYRREMHEYQHKGGEKRQKIAASSSAARASGSEEDDDGGAPPPKPTYKTTSGGSSSAAARKKKQQQQEEEEEELAAEEEEEHYEDEDE